MSAQAINGACALPVAFSDVTRFVASPFVSKDAIMLNTCALIASNKLENQACDLVFSL